MQKAKLNNFEIKNFNQVTLKEMGNTFEICFQTKTNHINYIRKLNENEYIYLPTGEILNAHHISNRSESLFQVSQSLKRLRDYINTNITNPKQAKWITLTYRENMQDTKKLYKDFEKFIKRFKYNFKDYHIEYIVAMEPQGRGAWHCHLLLIFNCDAPYISNKIISDLWKNGFTKTKKLNDIDNIGAYLSAYLSDFEIEYKPSFETQQHKLLKITTDESGNKKAFFKGARLYLYPPKFNLYRCSRGIKKPIKHILSYKEARKKIGLEHKPIFSTAMQLSDIPTRNGEPLQKTIAYEFYNTTRLLPQN